MVIGVVALVLVLTLVGGFFLVRALFSRATSQTTPAQVQPTPASTSPSAGQGTLSGSLEGSGASAAQVAMEAWSQDLSRTHPGLTLNYSPVGSGAGRADFSSGGSVFAMSDRALKDDEINRTTQCVGPAINLPVVVMPLAILANVPGTTQLTLDAPTLVAIYTGGITTWNDPRIASLNAGVTLPNTPITPVYRSDNAAVNEVLTAWLAPAGGSLGSGGEWKGTTGQAAKGSSGVATAVGSTAGALGYLESGLVPAGSTLISLRQGDKAYSPTGPQATQLLDQSPRVPGRGPNDLARVITPGTGDAYPLLRVTYLIVCEKYADPSQGELVQGTFSWIVSPEGHGRAVSAGGSARLSEQMYAELAAAVSTIS
ncbi:phosphate ABC transporter substrate-binding protein PstS [Ammonicoccus fulvus]|uniref:Phosphate-binding protein n=1 Tax=Ammonicoccus fulvus TaxID=3138240 RepID=A0ABZ3FSV0_9ACTN